MKKNIFKLSAIVVIATSLIFTGCKKDDVTAPVVTLLGDASTTISLNSATYIDAGATAEDDKDGATTPVMSGSVNVDLTGTYTITWTATDAAGNVGTATRTVIVRNDAFALAGTYSVSENINGTISIYPQTVSVSTTVNKRIDFNKFANYAGNTSIYAMVTGTSINLPSQTAVGIGTNNGGTCDVSDHTFVSQSGTTTTPSNGFTITFTDTQVGPGSCTSSPLLCIDTFTK